MKVSYTQYIEVGTIASALKTTEDFIKEIKPESLLSPAVAPAAHPRAVRKKHPRFEGFTDVVQVQYSSSSGRFMVADQDIQVRM